ncbi:hypothetical protein B0T24DRAFT_599290 [Lasiosphaeria ovina]|uniref:Uncharacterized protein n=1 Tax=Lasiosphaeria ovina TaxID=92902 RepID=A0AAE0JU99_9PEZI|nr:hypothetical protein B0T24DRAFT_599290 [Lasiosphaeria ovina]
MAASPEACPANTLAGGQAGRQTKSGKSGTRSINCASLGESLVNDRALPKPAARTDESPDPGPDSGATKAKDLLNLRRANNFPTIEPTEVDLGVGPGVHRSCRRRGQLWNTSWPTLRPIASRKPIWRAGSTVASAIIDFPVTSLSLSGSSAAGRWAWRLRLILDQSLSSNVDEARRGETGGPKPMHGSSRQAKRYVGQWSVSPAAGSPPKQPSDDGCARLPGFCQVTRVV